VGVGDAEGNRVVAKRVWPMPDLAASGSWTNRLLTGIYQASDCRRLVQLACVNVADIRRCHTPASHSQVH